MVYAFVDCKLWFTTTLPQRLNHSFRFLEWNNFVSITMKYLNRLFPHLKSV